MKSKDAFRTISEAAREVGVPQHVLRHWEDVFGQVRPMRRAGGRRFYRTGDIELLIGIRMLLHDEKYSTKGVQKILKESGAGHVAQLGRKAQEDMTPDGGDDSQDALAAAQVGPAAPARGASAPAILTQPASEEAQPPGVAPAAVADGAGQAAPAPDDRDDLLQVVCRLLERIDVVQDQLDEVTLAIEGVVVAFEDGLTRAP